MRLRKKTDEAPDEDDDGYEDAPAPPPVAYRVAGDVQVRAAELEQEVGELRAKAKEMEREMWRARKNLREQTAIRHVSVAGLGSLVGTILGAMAWGLSDVPGLMIAGACVGFAAALVMSWRAKPPDDNFPPAPPARMY